MYVCVWGGGSKEGGCCCKGVSERLSEGWWQCCWWWWWDQPWQVTVSTACGGMCVLRGCAVARVRVGCV